MASKFLMLAALLMVEAGGERMAAAQPVNFTCPKAGTVEIRDVYKVLYLGPSDSDPYVCISLDAWGKKNARLFNYILVNDADKAPAARDALIALMSGNKKSASFDHTSVVNRFAFHHTWTLLRREPLTVGGKTFDTIVFERTSRAINTTWDGEYQLWLDPASGLWLKSLFRSINGRSGGPYGNYEDVSISVSPSQQGNRLNGGG